MRVLLTGAGGRIGSILRRELTEHDLISLTRSPAGFPSQVGDVSDLESIRPAFEGVDSVIHLAAASAVRSEWESILPANIVGARNVFEAARLAGVEQVVYASSTHTVAGHERALAPELYELDDGRTLGGDLEARPDSLYGASKAFGEALGRWYSDSHGLRVICLRIGYVSAAADADFESAREDDPTLDAQARISRMRMRAIWLSHRDCAQLFRSALASPLPWAVVYGTSNNPRQIWDLEPARRLLGFAPQDSAPV